MHETMGENIRKNKCKKVGMMRNSEEIPYAC